MKPLTKRPVAYDRRSKTDYVADLFVRGTFGMFRLFPYPTSIWLAGWISRRLLAPLGGMNRRIRANLAHVKPDLPAAEVAKICAAVCDNFGRVILESISVEGFIRRAKAAPMSGPGLADLLEALKSQRPVILVSGHFGNYQVVRVLLSQMGHDTAGIYRPLNNGYTNRHYINNMNKVAGPNFSIGINGTKQIISRLRGGGSIALLLDQHAHEGEELQFMGKPAFALLSAAEMAVKFNALLIPCFCIRQENGLDFDVVIEPPIPHTDPKQMMQNFNDVLEARVWKNPGQWFWIHRRWKARG